MITALALKNVNMLASRFSEVLGYDWGYGVEFEQGTGDKPKEGSEGGKQESGTGLEGDIEIGGIKIPKTLALGLAGLLMFRR